MKKINNSKKMSNTNILIFILISILILTLFYVFYYKRNYENFTNNEIAEEEEEENRKLSFQVVYNDLKPVINPITKKPIYSSIQPIGTKLIKNEWVTQLQNQPPYGMISYCDFLTEKNKDYYKDYDKITGRYCLGNKLF